MMGANFISMSFSEKKVVRKEIGRFQGGALFDSNSAEENNFSTYVFGNE